MAHRSHGKTHQPKTSSSSKISSGHQTWLQNPLFIVYFPIKISMDKEKSWNFNCHVRLPYIIYICIFKHWLASILWFAQRGHGSSNPVQLFSKSRTFPWENWSANGGCLGKLPLISCWGFQEYIHATLWFIFLEKNWVIPNCESANCGLYSKVESANCVFLGILSQFVHGNFHGKNMTLNIFKPLLACGIHKGTTTKKANE